jgi:hypothetical protein
MLQQAVHEVTAVLKEQYTGVHAAILHLRSL